MIFVFHQLFDSSTYVYLLTLRLHHTTIIIIQYNNIHSSVLDLGLLLNTFLDLLTNCFSHGRRHCITHLQGRHEMLASSLLTVRNLGKDRASGCHVTAQLPPISHPPNTLSKKETTYLSVLVKDVSKEPEGIWESL